MFKINIVEDEENLNILLKTYLEKEGYIVKAFTHYQDAMENIEDDADLWVVDLMLDEHSGFDILQAIREVYIEKPVVLMSARGQEFDRVIGLEKGADDYISKPFSPKEVVLRIQNILRRNVKTMSARFESDGYVIDARKRRVYLDDKEIELTTKEYELLSFFIENRTVAFSRGEILGQVWDEYYYGSDRVVDDTLRRLRKKMPNLNIRTIYGYGYRLD